MKKKFLIIIVIVVIAAAGYFGYLRLNAQDNENQGIQITENNTVEVSKGSMKKTIAVSGNIYPIEEQNLSFSTEGTVSSVNVEEGERVNEDDVLIELKNNRAELEYIKAENSYKTAQINGSKNAIQEAKLNYEIAKDNYEDTRLKAPYSGVITDLLVQESDFLTSGQEVAVLIDNTQYEVKANIDESELSKLKLGQDVEITMEALPEEQLLGKLTDISSKAESTSGVVTIPITVLIDGVKESFKPGLSADMDIIVDEIKDEIIIPVTAVIDREGKKYVQKVEGESTNLVEIKTGLTDGIRVVILSGLNQGDKIISNTAALTNNLPQGFGGPGSGMRAPGGGN
ncbi:MAG: efflux RND transporter periplasmic adaptor subunit [Bacillota bacterium]